MSHLFGLSEEFSYSSEVNRSIRLVREFFLISAFRLTDGRGIGQKSKQTFKEWLTDFLKMNAATHSRFCNGDSEILSSVCSKMGTLTQQHYVLSEAQQLIHRRLVGKFMQAVDEEQSGDQFLMRVSPGQPINDLIEVTFESVSWLRFFRSVLSESSYTLVFGSDVEKDYTPDEFIRPSVFSDEDVKDTVSGKSKRSIPKNKATIVKNTKSTELAAPSQTGLKIKKDMSAKLDTEGVERLQSLRSCWSRIAKKGSQSPGDDFLIERWVSSVNPVIKPTDVLKWLKEGSDSRMDELIRG